MFLAFQKFVFLLGDKWREAVNCVTTGAEFSCKQRDELTQTVINGKNISKRQKRTCSLLPAAIMHGG